LKNDFEKKLVFFGAFRGQNLLFQANTALISAAGDFFGYF
jgi:hypothetical protein